ncbi:hypothetical protein EPO05_04180 [Patescibacteria group bacterium]|nr:MAG: hypothetical protein EPO05_04180 [Patescibacteria group bacterium]
MHGIIYQSFKTFFMWIPYAVVGALLQAVSAAIKKKSLKKAGMNNVIGFISFLIAGILFGVTYGLTMGTFWPAELSARFWEGMTANVALNIVGIWFMYRALDSAEFNYLMPFMTLTSLTIILPPIFLLGEIPSVTSLLGIILVVVGALVMNYVSKKKVFSEAEAQQRKDNLKGALYFIATAICFTFTPTTAKIAIQESSVLFTSFMAHILISFGFLAMLLIFREGQRMKAMLGQEESRPFLYGLLLAGVVIAVENGSINLALDIAPVAYVMALKRLMPLFAFLIGYFYFKERTHLLRKSIATALMVAGTMVITIFK